MIYRKDNKVLEIYKDEEPSNPREWDSFTRMVCFHRDYILGDDTELKSRMFSNWEEVKQHLIKEEGAKVIMPLYLLDHSGLSISLYPFSCPWDSKQVGFIFISADMMKTHKLTEKRAKEIIKADVKVYDQYLIGDVYFYNLYEEEKCNCCGNVSKNLLDSVGGFFGSKFEENGLFDSAGVDIKKWVVEDDEFQLH